MLVGDVHVVGDNRAINTTSTGAVDGSMLSDQPAVITYDALDRVALFIAEGPLPDRVRNMRSTYASSRATPVPLATAVANRTIFAGA